jgi:hypothetical protein
MLMEIDVICKTYFSRVSLVGTALGVALTHHISSLLVVVDTAKLITFTRRNDSNTIKRFVFFKSILDFLGGGGFESFSVRVLQSGDRAGLVAGVTGQESSIIGTFVVVWKLVGSRIEAIDQVSTRDMALVKVRSTVGLLAVLSKHVQRLVGCIPRVALTKRAGPTRASSRSLAHAVFTTEVATVGRRRTLLEIRELGVAAGRASAGMTDVCLRTLSISTHGVAERVLGRGGRRYGR